MKQISRYFLMATLAFTMSACAATPQEPTFGEKLQGQGTEVEKIGKDWSKGEDMVLEGQNLVKDGKEEIKRGEKIISKGEKKVSKGESLIKDGKRLMSRAEKAYDSHNAVTTQ